MKKAMKIFKSSHEDFRIPYLYFDMQLGGWDKFKFNFGYFGQVFKDLIDSIKRTYGKKYTPDLNISGLSYINLSLPSKQPQSAKGRSSNKETKCSSSIDIQDPGKNVTQICESELDILSQPLAFDKNSPE